MNRTFENWFKQQHNRIKKNNSKNGAHLLISCNEKNCNCIITNDLKHKAFDLALSNMSMFSSLNKIYKFNENFDLLRDKIESFLACNKNFEKAKLINELDLYEKYDIDLKEVIFF